MTWRRPARDSSKFKPNTLTIQAIASGESGGRGQRRCHLQGNLRDQCYTYQGSLGALHVYMGRSWVPTRGLWAILGPEAPIGPGPGHAGAWARAPGPGPGMARGPKDPKGRIRQGPDPWHPLAGACRCPLFCERGFRHPNHFQKVRKCSAVRRFEILHLRSPT